jgi:glucose-1-phosphate cytidylyltransferase
MKAVILAGGKGTRLSEVTESIPKPLVEIDELPIIIHIMDTFSKFGVKDFLVLTGYKGNQISEFFLNYWNRTSNFSVNIQSGKVQTFNADVSRDWDVTVMNTGYDTMTGGRILRAKKFLELEENFFVTYGDGLANLELDKLLESHLRSKKIATVTAVSPPGRFGNLELQKNGLVSKFIEKPQNSDSYINGGYFVFNQKIFDYLENDMTVLENEPLGNLASNSQLNAFIHPGFWQCMDTLRDLNYLRELAQLATPPWVANEN